MTTLGIDIGCISLKAALVGKAGDQDLFGDLLSRHPDLFQTPGDGLTVVGEAPVLVARYRRIKGSPAEAVEALLAEVLAVLPEGSVRGARVTGSGGRLVARRSISVRERVQGHRARHRRAPPRDRNRLRDGRRELQVHPPSRTTSAARHRRLPDQRRLRRRHRFLHGPAGQAAPLRDRGRRRHRARRRKAASIAGRCSVFAKSDMIHAQQKGYQPPEVLRGLCDAVARNFKSTIANGKVVQAARRIHRRRGRQRGRRALAAPLTVRLEDGQLFIPEYHASIEADRRRAHRGRPRGTPRERSLAGLDTKGLPADLPP